MAVKYFDNIDGVKSGVIGRLLPPMLTEDFEDYRYRVRTGEHLYMLLASPLKSIMVLVDEPSEYNHFYGQYSSGIYTERNLYALPTNVVQ